MDLTHIVSANLKAACVEFDISTRDLATRANSNQKSVWNILNGTHSPRLSTLEPICQTLMVSPAAVVTPHIDTGLLVSRRVPRLIDKYAKLSFAQREQLETIMDDMLSS